jgi:hypothetical protein
MRTTKPPVSKKKKAVKEQVIEPQSTEFPDISKQNYHYAKEKLKKDQERLKKSANKMRTTGIINEKPLNKRQRNMSKVIQDPAPAKHSFLKKKESAYRPSSVARKPAKRTDNRMNITSSNKNFDRNNSRDLPKANQDLDEVMFKSSQVDNDSFLKRKQENLAENSPIVQSEIVSKFGNLPLN